jgi:hypothetical protein
MTAVRRFRIWTVFLLVLTSALGRKSLASVDDADARLFVAVRLAIANNSVVKTEAVGFTLQKTPFNDRPAEEGVLIGFDIALKKGGKEETVVGLRPIYRTATQEIASPEYGPFRSAATSATKQPQRNQTIRVVRAKATPGYAVGTIKLRAGIGIRGMSLTFMRIQGETLDPQQAYSSDWIGAETGGREAALDGEGAPIVGVFGNLDAQRVLALGVSYIRVQSPVAKNPASGARTKKARTTADDQAGLPRSKELAPKPEENAGQAGLGERAGPAPKLALAEPEPQAAAPPPAKENGDQKNGEGAQNSAWIWKVAVPVFAVACFLALFLAVGLIRSRRLATAMPGRHQANADPDVLPPTAGLSNSTRSKNPLFAAAAMNKGASFTIGFVVLAVIFFGIWRDSGKSGAFQEFASASGKFQVEIPGTPTEETALAAGITYTMYRVAERDGAYGVAYADVPGSGGLSASQIEQGLNSARDGMVSNVNGKFIGESSITLNRVHPGREVRASLPIQDGIMIGRIYFVKQRLYMVVVTGQSQWVNSFNAKRFLDSLEVTN